MFKINKLTIIRVVLLIFSLIHYFLTLNWGFLGSFYTAVKILSFFTVILLWQIPVFIYEKYKSNPEKFKTFSKFFCIYFLFLFVIFLFIPKGRFTIDELSLFASIKLKNNMFWVYWYHILTSLYYGIIIELFKTQSAIIFVQISIISTIFSCIGTQLKLMFKSKWSLLPLIIFFFPCILEMVFCPARITFYSFILLSFLFLTFIKYSGDGIEISYKNILLASLFITLLITYRGEGFVYIFAPLFLFLLFRKYLTIKRTLIFLFSLIIFSSSVLFLQSRGNLDAPYRNLPMVYEIQKMLTKYNNFKITNEQISIIEKYTTIEDLKNDKTDADQLAERINNDKEFQSLFVQLVINNFKEFLIQRSFHIKDAVYMHGVLPKELSFVKNKSVYCKLCLSNEDCNPYNSIFWQKLSFLYSGFIVIFALLINLIFGVISSNKFYLHSNLLLLLHFAVVTLTAHVPFFDYYWPVYLSAVFFMLLIPCLYLKKTEAK